MRLVLLLVLFTSCLTQRKAEKRINKIANKYPDAIINRADKLAPLDTFDFNKWKTEVDSIYKDYIANTDTLENKNNSETIIKCNEIIKENVKYITKIKEKVINIPPIIKTDTGRIMQLHKQIADIKKQSEKTKRTSWVYLGMALSLFALLLLVLLFRFKK